MAITSEIIGKLGGADVEQIPVDVTASGRSGSEEVFHTVEVPEGETWLVAAVGTTANDGIDYAEYPLIGIGSTRLPFLGAGGVAAVVTGTAQITLTRQITYESDSFTGHVYTVKL